MPFIMATVLIDMISIGLIIPVLPKLVASFETTPAAQVGAYAWVLVAGVLVVLGAVTLR